jgi:hypothetical protein
MTTLTPQLPTLATPVTPTQTAATTADKFLASPGCTYLIHYENGATPTTQCYVLEQVATLPPGAPTPATPTGAAKWSDALISSAIAANSERDIAIDKSVIQNYMDANGFVNLKHNTPTTLTVAVYGPF